MNQIAAFKETLELARKHNMDNSSSDVPELDYPHLQYMYDRALLASEGEQPFSEDKIGRWLGWAQAAVMAYGNGSIPLNEIKELNKRHT